MPFVSETISAQDRQKLLRDAAREPGLLARFSRWGELVGPGPTMRWAVDRETGNFLFRAPEFARELDNEYYFGFRGQVYAVVVAAQPAGWPTRVVTWDHRAVHELDEALKADLTEAFRVHGLHGYGEFDYKGRPLGTRVVPTFEGSF